MTLRDPDILMHEMSVCKREFRAQGKTLDVVLPKLVNPARSKFGPCSICDVQLLKENVGTANAHRPVDIRCGHIFGFACIQKYFQGLPRWTCPTCHADLTAAPQHPINPGEVLESCDRVLKWLEAPIQLVVPEAPHSYPNKLALVFEPANDIREHMLHWPPSPEDAYAERFRIDDLVLYLARDRLDAAIKKDVVKYREIVVLQVQAGARRAWLAFRARCYPDASPDW